MSRVTVVVVSYNSSELLRKCLCSLSDEAADCSLDVVVVDNASSDGTLEMLRREFTQVKVIASGSNLGYGGGANEALKQSDSEYVIVSNLDVVYPQGSVAPLVRQLDGDPELGGVGPQQVYPDGSWQRSHGTVPGLGAAVSDLLGLTSLRHLYYDFARRRSASAAREPVDVSYLDGAILVLRRRALEEVGGFDLAFSFYAEDMDLCHRLRRAGWRLVLVPESEVIHLRGESSRKRAPERYAAALSRANARFAYKHLSDPDALAYLAVMTCHFFVRHCLCRARQLVSPQGRVQAGDRARYFWALCVNYARVLLRPSDELC